MTRPRALLLSGGVGHPFTATSAQVAELLRQVGVETRVTDELEPALAELSQAPVDLLVVNALRWRMEADRYAHLRDDWAFSLSTVGRDAIEGHLAGGRPLLALHTAVICFDDWPRWGAIVGAAWDWDRSFHPPLGEARMHVADHHPITAGLEDFAIVDEVYGFLGEAADLNPLVWSEHSGREHPLLWAREVGGARLVYDALGHDERSFEHPTHREIVRRSARWLLSGDVVPSDRSAPDVAIGAATSDSEGGARR